MKKSFANELKTVVMVILCFTALTALLLRVGNYQFMKPGYTLKTRFHYTGGVKLFAPVCLAGVEVGQIKGINIVYGDDTLVEVDLWIKDGIKVHKDALAYSTTYGLMGEKYIEIKPGTAAAGYAGPGDILPGKDPVRLEELIDIGKKVASDISAMANDISSVARNIDGVIGENRQKINVIMDNIEDASENFDYFSENIMHHPWKFLNKGKELTDEEMAAERAKRWENRARKKAALEAAKKAGAASIVGSESALSKTTNIAA
ncbi:MAG: MlaD family protein, partial [Candidatus Omnitrophota bacterium]